MSNTRYWLLVLLIPLLGVWLLGVSMGMVEWLVWLALAVAWVVAYLKHDRVKPQVPLIALGVVVGLGAAFAVYNHATAPGSYATADKQPATAD